MDQLIKEEDENVGSCRFNNSLIEKVKEIKTGTMSIQT